MSWLLFLIRGKKRREAEASARSDALSGCIIINVTDAYFMPRHRELLHRRAANEMNGRILQTVIAASHNYSPWQEACAYTGRPAKYNKCTRESNKRQTPITNHQTISVRSATSGDLFVIKNATTINPVERIFPQFDV